MVPITCGKRELVGEGETKNFLYRMAQNFTCMWGSESFPTLVHQGMGKGQDGLTRAKQDQDQAAAWRDGGELEL